MNLLSSAPLVRSKKASLIMGLVLTLPILLSAFSAVTKAYVVLFLLFLHPLLMGICTLWCGSGCGMLAALSGCLGAYFAFGSTGLGIACVYLLPFLITILYVLNKKIPFFKGCGMLAAVFLLSQMVCFLMLKAQCPDGDVYRAAGEGFAGLLTESGQGDYILAFLYQSGFLTISESVQSDAFVQIGEYYYLTEAGVQELLLALTGLIEDAAKALPACIVSDSILFSAGSLGLGLYIGKISYQRRNFKREDAPEDLDDNQQTVTPPEPDFPDLQMPALSDWFLPRRVGLCVALFASGYVIAMVSSGEAAYMLGNMMFSVFSSVYMLQGMASLDFLHKKLGRKVVSRRVWLIVFTVLASSVLVILGCVDQLTNYRKKRPPMGQNNSDYNQEG